MRILIDRFKKYGSDIIAILVSFVQFFSHFIRAKFFVQASFLFLPEVGYHRNEFIQVCWKG